MSAWRRFGSRSRGTVAVLLAFGHDRLSLLQAGLQAGGHPHPSAGRELSAGVVILGNSAHKVSARFFQAVAEFSKIGGHKRFTNRRLKWDFVVKAWHVGSGFRKQPLGLFHFLNFSAVERGLDLSRHKLRKWAAPVVME